MKIGDRVKINIRAGREESYCKWLYDGCQHTYGTIEREYPEHIVSMSGYEYLVRFDNPVAHITEHWRPMTHLWFNGKDLEVNL